jgi:hypothetical protein
MQFFRRHPLATTLVATALILAIVIGGYSMYLASESGLLPWQPEPTLIPVTPFSDFPGFGGSTSTPQAGTGG